MRPGEEQVELTTADGFRLQGTLVAPAEPRSVALLLHGITLNREEYGGLYADLAAELAAHGVASLRFDFRGHGESDGSGLDISVVGECLDIRAAIAFLRGRTAVPIQAVAASFSAGPAVFVCADPAARFERLALLAPVLSYERTFLRPSTPWGERWFGPPAFAAADRDGHSRLEQTDLSVRLFEELRLLAPAAVLPRLPVPVLVIHGDRDSMVPFAVTEELVRAAGDVRFQPLAGADHLFAVPGDDGAASGPSLANRATLIATVADFLAG